ncbi:hypothetical protein Hanom_Chr08g00758611 [Helianthus anomalus]
MWRLSFLTFCAFSYGHFHQSQNPISHFDYASRLLAFLLLPGSSHQVYMLFPSRVPCHVC